MSPTQESKLYDPDQGTYYYFDPETRHSRVKLPAKTEPDQEKTDGVDTSKVNITHTLMLNTVIQLLSEIWRFTDPLEQLQC